MSKVAVDVLKTTRVADEAAPIYGREIVAGTTDQVPEALFADLKKEGYVIEAGAEHPRLDGPTIAEWVDAGYPASKYPPKGFAPQSSAEEIAEAIEAEKAKGAGGGGNGGDGNDDDEAKRNSEEAAKLKEAMEAELGAMTVAQLKDLAKAENVTLTAEDNRKDEIIARIVEARLAAPTA